METSWSQLIDLIPPPSNPEYPGNPSLWEKLENQIDMTLPSDYKWFVNTYGVGMIGYEIGIFNPFMRIGSSNFIYENVFLLNYFRERREEFPEHYTHRLYPETGGVLFCGFTSSASHICWKPEGNPDQWRIVLINDIYIEEHPLNLTSFISQCITNRLNSKLFPAEIEFTKENRFFKPSKEKS